MSNQTIDTGNSDASPKIHSALVTNTGRFTAGGSAPKRHFEAAACEGPGCESVIPAGWYGPQKTRSFCSRRCAGREAAGRYVVGICQHCGDSVFGRKDEVGKKPFCCQQHQRAHETERIMAPTGPFRSTIEEYMAGAAANYYRSTTLPTVRVSLSKFFRFVVQVEKITVLDNIRPAVITRFIVVERERGLTGRNFVGHLASFFRWLIVEERYDLASPVVSRIHSQRGAPAEARPYNDRDLNMIWGCIQRTDKTKFMLAFSIGEECGLRIGEVSNIRISDIDMVAQTIHVRLPTKNMRERTVPYHNKVKKHLALWLTERDPRCKGDHLLHNNVYKRFNGSQLDAWFKKLLSKELEPAGSFSFHRLRHTWATRLMNNGMELAVLKELGGWESWNSMQRYIKVLESTVRSQYEASYSKLQEKQESGEDEAISLVDFALMESEEPATSTESIT
jgi:integrase